MATLLDFATNTSVAALLAGGALAVGDVAVEAADGLFWPGAVTDYSAVANQGSTVVPDTVVSANGGVPDCSFMQQQCVRDPVTGNLFVLTGNGSGQGAVLYKYNSVGGNVQSVAVDATAANQLNPRLKMLANGTLALMWVVGSAGAYKYAVYDTFLQVVKAATSTGVVQPSSLYYSDMIALSGGGFMIAAPKNDNTMQVGVIDNTGTITVAFASIFALTGVPGGVAVALAQLSNGNVAYAFQSNYATTIGLYYGIVSSAAAVVVAATLIAAGEVGGSTYFPEIDSFSVGGFFAITNLTTAAIKVRVYNNAGVIQGAAYSTANTTNLLARKFKTVDDGTNFWTTFYTGSSTISLVKVPTTGTNYVTYAGIYTATSFSSGMNAFYERGRIVIIYNNAVSLQWSYGVLNISGTSPYVEKAATAFGTAAGTTIGIMAGCLAGGDFTIICVYDTNTTSALNIIGFKYINTAIQGLVVAAAAAGSVAYAKTLTVAGASLVSNTLIGSPSVGFDHSATNIKGRKGTIAQRSLALVA